jgi:hypothetical protein
MGALRVFAPLDRFTRHKNLKKSAAARTKQLSSRLKKSNKFNHLEHFDLLEP